MEKFFYINKKIIFLTVLLLTILSPNISIEKKDITNYLLQDYQHYFKISKNKFLEIKINNVILAQDVPRTGYLPQPSQTLTPQIDPQIQLPSDLAQEQADLNKEINEEAERRRSNVTPVTNDDCGAFLWNVFCHIDKGVQNIVEKIGLLIFSLCAAILYLAGTLFNLAIGEGIIKMASYVKIEGVYAGWTVVRDLLNIGIIFGMLYISINTILKGFAQNQKSLASIIFAAIFINFSFFIASVLVDASNMLSLQVYNSMTCNTSGSKEKISGISECFMKHLGLQTIFNSGSAGTGGEVTVNDWANKNGYEKFKFYFLGAIFVFIAAIIFIALAVMIIARLITIVVLMILSPVMFLGMIIPYLSDTAKKWSKSFTDMLISLPAMIICLYVVFQILASGIVNTSGGSLNGAISGGSGSVKIIINYAIVIGFMLAVLKVGKATGAAGANFASTVGKAAALGIGFGGVAMLARGMVGGAGVAMRRYAVKNPDSALARTAGRVGNSLANKSFDFRNTKAASALGSMGVDLGKGSNRTFDNQLNVKKRYEEYGEKRTDARVKQNLELYGKTDDFMEKRKKAEEAARDKVNSGVYSNPDYIVRKNQIKAEEKAAELQDLQDNKDIAEMEQLFKSAATDTERKDYASRIASKKANISDRANSISKLKSEQENMLKEATKKNLEKEMEAEFKKLGIASKDEIKKSVKKMTTDKASQNHDELMNALKQNNKS